MKKYSDKKAISFDDILMVPQHSDINSRRNVDLSMNIGNKSFLNTPIIASPMDTVCESEMAVAMAKNGAIGIIHRFMPIEKQILEVSKVASRGFAVGAAIGVKGDFEYNVLKLISVGASLILIDTANGHSEYAIEATKKLRRLAKESVHVMVGNVSTGEGYKKLAKAGADSVRVGIGGGSVCTTRLVSGHGIPTLTSIMDVKEAKDRNDINVGIIADGGIKNSGDMVKAFAGGADAVMLGSILAGTDESPGEIYQDNSGKYKIFRGMASAEANQGKDIAVAEGISTKISYKGSVYDIIKDIRGGIGSGCSYSGVSKLKDLYTNAMYIKVSTLTIKESMPHV
jgi:IMP dehydrogenase